MKLGKVKYINTETHNGLLKRSQVSEGDLLVKITGVGRMAVAQNNLPKCLLNQRIAKVYVNDENNNIYIQSVLNSPIGVKQFSKIGTGGIQINIGISDIENLKIPLPPKEKQDEIANHITAIRKQAQALKDKTKALIIKNNKEIEKILLG